MSNRTALLTLSNMLAEVREIDPYMHVQVLTALVVIARKPGCSPGDLIAEVGTTSASVARIIARLSTWEAKRAKGYGLIHVEMDVEDRRRRMLWLTPAGQKFIKRLEAVLA